MQAGEKNLNTGKNIGKNPEDLLTCIHAAYTVSATPDADIGEVNDIMIKNFLNTLAEVALTVASRKINKEVNR